MNLDVMRELVRLMEDSGLTAMEVQDGGFRVRLENMSRLGGNGQDWSGMTMTPDGPSVVYPATQKSPDAPERSAEEASREDAPPHPEDSALTMPPGKQLLSPMVGTFHELPEDRRVPVGAALKKGDPVCVLEAMKVMNEILMEEDGTIAYIAAKEGDMVEYGQVLYVFA